MSFPTSGVPAQVTDFLCDDRNGIFHLGETVTLTQGRNLIVQPRTYEVRDYHGNVVSSGNIGASDTVITPDPPVGGWPCGWYRFYMSGPDQGDPTYGTAYGAYNFVVVRDTAGYPTNHTRSEDLSYFHGSEDRDVVMKGVLGVGTSRLQISDVTNLNAGSNSLPINVDGANYMAEKFRYDAARPRPMMCQFPNDAYYNVDIGLVFPGVDPLSNVWLRLYAKNGVDSGLVWFRGSQGTIEGGKLEIFYPDDSTLVETFDNLVGADEALNAQINSAYVVAVSYGGDMDVVPGPITNIGRTKRDGMIEVVETLFPLGVTHYEGPANEPRTTGSHWVIGLVQSMRVFQDAVHEGNPDAVAMGPVVVSIEPGLWEAILTEGIADYCDELSFHAYNSQTNGDINLGRSSIKAFADLLADHDVDLTWWHTEATHVFTSVYAVTHPRRSRVPLLMSLQFEQFGLPRERNQVWYDRSHGFWDYPSWLENSDGSLVPYASLYRTLSEETYGMTHHHPIDFGSVQANRFLIGSVYTSSDGASTAVIVSQSFMDDLTVTLTILGTTDPITVVDAWGNETVVAQTSGRIVVPVDDIPTYVQLPAGVHCWVYAVNDWGPSPPQSISVLAHAEVGGVDAPMLGDALFMSDYGGRQGIFYSEAALPAAAALTWAENVTVDRIIVYCGSPWQQISGLVDFDVDTWDGATWTTRATVTKTTPSSFEFPTYFGNAGCTFETYWDEQGVFDVSLPAPVDCLGVRVNVNATSYGGEPDFQAADGVGQGNATQQIVLQEIMVPSDSRPTTLTNPYLEEVLADAPVGYWRVGELAGPTAFDSSGNDLDGTYGGTDGFGQPGPIGDGNAAIASGCYIHIPHDPVLNVGDQFTYEFWARTGSAETHNYVLGKGAFGPPSITINSRVVQMIPFGEATPVVSSNIEIPDSGWHHWVITKDGPDCFMYMDGVDVTDPGTDHTYNNNTADLWFGTTDGIDIFQNGAVDEFALYDHALTVDRVAAHYQASTTPGAVPVIREQPLVFA